MSQLAAERYLAQTGPVDAETAAALQSGAAVPWNPPADTAAIIAADAAVAQEAALSGLQGVVATWQQELMAFREVWPWPGGSLPIPRLCWRPLHWFCPSLQHALGTGTAARVSSFASVTSQKRDACCGLLPVHGPDTVSGCVCMPAGLSRAT